MPTKHRDAHTDKATSQPDLVNPFAGFGSGLDFFQEWMKAAGNAMPHLPGQANSAASLGGASASWSMPTLDPQEIDKRIQDLKTVQFWLEQNARMIAMTIQGLEVQRMTLSTLQSMNVSMDTLKDLLKAQAQPKADAPKAPHETPATVTPPGADLINPMQWWDTLTQQFTHLATQTVNATADVATKVAQASSHIDTDSGKKTTKDTAKSGDKSAPKANGKGRTRGSANAD